MGIVSREVRKARREIIDADYSTSPPCGKIRQMNRCLAFLMLSVAYGQVQKPFTVVEATIPQMQRAMRQGRVTSRQLVMQYPVRIGLYQNNLHPPNPANRHPPNQPTPHHHQPTP